MKEFLKGCKKINKMKTGELASVIYENQDRLVDFYTKKAHLKESAEVINELFSKMNNEKFIKALNKIRKSDDEEVKLNIGLAVIIAGFIEKKHNDPETSEEIIDAYTNLISKLLKTRIKEVNKKLNLDDDLIADMLLIVPEKSYIKNDKIVGIYSQKMLRKLYILSQDKDIGINDIKTVKKLFKRLIGENLYDLIAVNILLEKKEFLKNLNERQQAIWNLMTNFAMTIIESQDKKHIGELIEYYVNRRKRDAKNDRDAARRISLTSVDAEQYPKTAKVISKLVKSNSDIEKYL